jgi:hypothetical protein
MSFSPPVKPPFFACLPAGRQGRDGGRKEEYILTRYWMFENYTSPFKSLTVISSISILLRTFSMKLEVPR